MSLQDVAAMIGLSAIAAAFIRWWLGQTETTQTLSGFALFLTGFGGLLLLYVRSESYSTALQTLVRFVRPDQLKAATAALDQAAGSYTAVGYACGAALSIGLALTMINVRR